MAVWGVAIARVRALLLQNGVFLARAHAYFVRALCVVCHFASRLPESICNNHTEQINLQTYAQNVNGLYRLSKATHQISPAISSAVIISIISAHTRHQNTRFLFIKFLILH